MSTLYQMRAVVELTNQGWEAVRFPDRDVEHAVLGGNTYMVNKQHTMIVVDAKGDAYEVDIGLETAKTKPPIYKSQDE